jgi:hypothetical protein
VKVAVMLIVSSALVAGCGSEALQLRLLGAPVRLL